MITLKECAEMRMMRYSIKVVFEVPNKYRFTKYFTTAAEADDFTDRAKTNGLRMLERDELYGMA